MSILSILVTKVRGWTPDRDHPAIVKPARALVPAEAQGAHDALSQRPARAFTPAFCAKLVECDPSRTMGDWA